MIGRADIEGSKATPLMNAWLPQASYPCDVPPSQTPHLTMSSARSTRRRVLGLKEGVVTPPPIHGSDSPCPHFSSELAVRRPGKLPKSRSQSAPADTRRSARHVSAQAARQQSTGSNWDPEPSPQSQSFSGYGSILPTSLPTLFHRPEAVHLGDLMRYEYDRRERTRSSGFSRAECTDTTRRGGALPAADPTAEPLPGWAGC
ncbi:hypothetical protein Bca4012_102678 [Brassica carinata]